MNGFLRYTIVAACALAALLCTFRALNGAIRGNQNSAVIELRDSGKAVVMRILPATDRPLAFKPNPDPDERFPRAELRSLAFHQNPPLIVWTGLMITMVTAAAGAFPVLLAQIDKLRRDAGLSWKSVLLSVLLAFMLLRCVGYITDASAHVLMLEYAVQQAGVLFGDSNIVQILVYITLILALPAIVLILLVAFAAGNEAPKNTDAGDLKTGMLRVARLHSILTASLQLQSVIIVLAVLTTTTLSEALKRVIEVRNKSTVPFELFPASHAYLYGLSFSLFLAILYFPAHFLLKERWSAIRNALWLNPDLQQWKEDPAELRSLQGGPMEPVKVALSILAPLITSILPEHLNLAA